MNSVSLMDRVPVDGVRLDAQGNLVGMARAARTGIQIYAGFEVGKPEMKTVRVFRPEEEVFNRDAMRSFAAAPVTINHPPVLVDPTNWAEYAKGETGSDDIVRDGETVRVPFIIRDAKAIVQIGDGKHEVSMGYTSTLDFTAGQTPGGEAYDAKQTNIRINHLAIVDQARGGPALRIGDSEQKDTPKVKTMIVDGLMVEVTDAAEAAILKLQGTAKTLGDSLTAMTVERDAANVAKSTAEGAVAAMTTQLADATNPAALAAAAAARADLIGKATKIVPGIVTDGKTDDEIRKAVVDAKMGATAATLADQNHINGAFAALTIGVTAAAPVARTVDGVAAVIVNGSVVTDADPNSIQTLRDASNKAKADRMAWLHGETPKTAAA